MKEQIKEMYGDVRNAIVHNSAVDFSRGCILSVDFDGVTRELYDDGYRKQSEVAREIFAEIDSMIFGTIIPDDCAIISIARLAELKKKYTEDQDDG